MSAYARRAVGVAAAAAIVIGFAAPADAASSHWGREYFLITYADNTQTVVAHGAFAGAGRDVEHDQSDSLYLGGGKLEIYHPDSQGTFSFKLNPKTCFASGTGRGKYTVGAGTGRFTGVTGHGTYVIKEQFILPRKKSGACNPNGDPKHFAGYVHASGPVYRS